ncbi:tol-pal system protein YbgF [Vibrio ruber DSM 16370]|uniref:Cell division coordinator CpoB n=1 Tax=Vibrio ruber (strain DSM 16370 / JCM 11486 / BCRC 17186 / CECT 7878 / LMG 23124 / VR1) TaxID=1123498 RepID=A0A1R4LH83_VIBR1|nr:tol-pal system protein YbgF [Vibrio ruber]SJN55931.1 tol-pal system protein YbgF [Vibrio ruber DSM 16370]
MLGNLKRHIVLMLLVSAASPVLAAPAPVSDLSENAEQNTASMSPETRVERLERLLQNSNRLRAQMQQQLDEMATDIQHLRGQLEKSDHDMGQMLTRQRELFVEIDRLREELNSKGSHEAQSGSKDNDQSASAGTYSEDANEQMAYQNAVDLILKKRDYAGAINAFTKFQRDFPKSNFAPNAHYWLGQLYYAKQQDDKAVESFKAVLDFPKSNKRADALVKLGDVEKRRRNDKLANQYYQQVIDEYPDTASAESAKRSMIK